MMFGRDLKCPIDIIASVPVQNDIQSCPVQYVEWLKHSLDLTFSFATSNLGKAASRQKKHYDRGVKPRNFSEGDFVWIWYPPSANIKFRLGWKGPYLVKKKITSATYTIRKDPKSKDIVVHVDHLKPYMGRQTPEEWRENEIIPENENDTFDSLSEDFNLGEMIDVQTPKPRDSESDNNESNNDQLLTRRHGKEHVAVAQSGSH